MNITNEQLEQWRVAAKSIKQIPDNPRFMSLTGSERSEVMRYYDMARTAIPALLNEIDALQIELDERNAFIKMTNDLRRQLEQAQAEIANGDRMKHNDLRGQ